MPREVIDVVTTAAYASGHTVSLLEFAPPLVHGAEPPASVAAAMGAADIALLLTSTPMAHTEATASAARNGTRCVFMEELTLDMLCHGAATADYDHMARLGEALSGKFNEGRRVKVTSGFGTDLEASIDGRRSWSLAGRAFSEPWFGLSGCCAFPDGECGIAPIEGSANGIVVFDSSVQGMGALDAPVRLVVRDSMIVEISGGRQAAQLERDLVATGDTASYFCPAEVAIGINEAAQVTGVLREDKKILGSCHIAYGANADIGGTVVAALHLDGLILRPTVEIDGDLIVEEGRIQVRS
jgi:2,5-dihydroxypyridine 5,6-dioxygenase